jgi:sodium/pantothenate symporter
MTPEIFKYLLTAFFVFLTFYLSWIGMKKTKDMKGYAIGNKDMNPYLIGITMAASISSTATFVINPGFVYIHGLSAYVHYAIAASSGILAAFILLTKGFRAMGEKSGSLTIPDWIFHRYGNRGLSLFFAVINLLSITFVVLILVGCSILMSSLFGIDQKMALTITLLFVFSYVLMGGTYAHAYTNTFQGIMMLGIALFLFFHGFKYFDGGFINALESVSPNYASVFNPDSVLYYDFFSVFVSGFIITFALMLQPHILTKVLYIKKDDDVNKFIGTTVVVGTCFALILFVGFYAKISGLDIARQDAVVAHYINAEFGGTTWGVYLLTFISISLLAAGMSTLDGILVALSAMVVNDIYGPLRGNKSNDPKKALKLSRYVLVAVGLFSYALAYHPPKLVGLFAQKGVYGLGAASLVPILFGVLYKKELPLWIVWCAALIGLIGHLSLNLFFGVLNPAVSSSYAILMSLGFTIAALTVRSLVPKKAMV